MRKDSMITRKYNCVELCIANVKNDNEGKLAVINLDSGNQLPYPIISGEFYNQLKSQNIIPNDIKLRMSKYKIESANQSPIMVRGTFKYPLKFFNEDVKFIFETFLVMDNLTSDINFGK